MKLDDLTPEELRAYIKHLNEKTTSSLTDLFYAFAKDITNMNILKKYLSKGEQEYFYKLKDLNTEIENKVNSLFDNVYDTTRKSSETAWKVGEKIVNATIKDKLINHSDLYTYLKRQGTLAHQNEAMSNFIINENRFKISSRIWKDEAKKQLEAAIQLGIAEGKSAAELTKDIRSFLQEPDHLYRRIRDKQTGELKLSKAAKEYHPGQGVYRSSYKNALRMAVNEINKSYRRSGWERIQNNFAIIGFRISLSNNHTLYGKPFVDICDYAQGIYPKNFEWSGWHVLCRCYMTPVFASNDDLNKMTKAIIEGKNPAKIKIRQIDSIPQKFIDWSARHRKQISGWSSKPDYILDNESYAEKYFVYKDVFKTPQGFVTKKRYKNGGKVMVQELVNKKASDYKDIFNICEEFARMGKTAKILPPVHYKSEEYAALFGSLEGTIYYRKCPDFKVGNKYFEYETYEPPFKKRKVSNMISHGAKQSPYIVIDNNKGVSDRYIRRTILERLKDKNFKYDIEEVWLYEKGKLRLLFKKQ